MSAFLSVPAAPGWASLLASEVFFDGGVKGSGIYRLGQVIVHACGQALFAHARLRGGGQGDNRNPRAGPLGSQAGGARRLLLRGSGRGTGLVLTDGGGGLV